MMKIISSTTLAFGWLVLFIGVNSVDISLVESLHESTVVPTPHPKTKFILDLRITNRIYHDSLNDQESEDYKSLKQEVEQLFFDVYGPTSLEYLGTDQMIFRNGSVIVSAQLLFGTTMIDPVLGRSLFFSTYKQLPSPTLEVDLDHAASLNSVDIFAEEPSTGTTAITTLQPESKFYMEIRITNRIYNSTLDEQESAEYMTLRQEVDQLFSDIYSLSPVSYISTDQVTFSNGSVIAGVDMLFGTTQNNEILLRSLFVANYKKLHSPQLKIDIQFVEDELPSPQPLEDTTILTSTIHLPSTSHITTHTTSHITTTHSPTHHTTLSTRTVVETSTHALHSSATLNPTSTPLSTTMHLNTNGTQSPKNNSNTSGTTAVTPNGNNTTTPHSSTNITISPHNDTNTSTPNHNDTNTSTPNHNDTNTSTPNHNGTNTSTPNHNGTNITISPHNGTNTSTPNHNDTNTSTPPNATMPSPIHNITNRISTISSRSTDSPTTAGALVPGWGIALLVLAAISLLLLIILLIILLVMCCCWPNKKTVVKEPEVITPPMYFNPDIPMYSTHSTIDSPNGKQVDVREKPPKNRTGMYVVNK